MEHLGERSGVYGTAVLRSGMVVGVPVCPRQYELAECSQCILRTNLPKRTFRTQLWVL